MADDANDSVHPLNIAELKLRLRHAAGNDYTTHTGVIEELIANSNSAQPLLPTVVDLYNNDNLRVAESALIRLYLATIDADLIAALRSKGAIAKANSYEQCQLFESGLSDLEATLLKHLWNHWETVGEPSRVYIVKALGDAGGTIAREALGVIRYRMAENVSVENAKLEREIDPHTINSQANLPEMSANANRSFLAEVRQAIARMDERGVK